MNDTCAAIEPLLARAGDGSLNADDQARLNAHLADCPSCRTALADQRVVREMLAGYPVEGARLGFDTRVMAAIRAEAEQRAGGWLGQLDFRRWTFRLVPVAVALALATVIVNQRDTSIGVAIDENATTTVAASTEDLPVSSALWSESVSGSSLLSLMLTANADDALSNHRKDQ